jgi:hypothetical protein
MERHRARAGHGWSRHPLLRNQPPQGQDRKPWYGQARCDRQGDGLPPALWFEEGLPGADGRGAAGRPERLAGRVERLFDAIKNPKTGEEYTSSEIARLSLGDLGVEDVEGLRSGSVADPPLSHLLALASTFGVGPSYLVDGTGEAALDHEIVEALGDDTVLAIARESVRLAERERKLVLGIVRQFEGTRAHEGSDRGAPSAEGR